MVYQNVGAILTCAGLSTRMNENKAFINWNGLPLIEQQINLLINSGLNQIAVVVGYEQDRFQYIKDKYSLVTFSLLSTNISAWSELLFLGALNLDSLLGE